MQTAYFFKFLVVIVLLHFLNNSAYAQMYEIVAEHHEQLKLSAQFIKSPSLELYQKLSTDHKASLMFFYNSTCTAFMCMDEHTPKSRLQAMRAVFAEVQKKQTPEEALAVNQGILGWAVLVISPEQGQNIKVNGTEYSNFEAMMDVLWQKGTLNDPKLTQKYICDYMVNYSHGHVEGIKLDDIARINSIFQTMSARVQKFDGKVGDNCTSEINLYQGKKEITFSLAQVMNIHRLHEQKLRDAERYKALKSPAGQSKPSDPNSFSSLSYCQRQQVQSAVDQFADFQNNNKSNRQFMILTGENFCKMTLRLEKGKKSDWTAFDYLNRDHRGKPLTSQFVTKADLFEVIMAKQSAAPKIEIVPAKTAPKAGGASEAPATILPRR